MDAGESNKQRQGEHYDQQEDRPVREGISNHAHERGSAKTPDRGKALIATKSFRQPRMADQTETDRSDCRPEQTACHPLERQGD
jgi:hypothetical protein